MRQLHIHPARQIRGAGIDAACRGKNFSLTMRQEALLRDALDRPAGAYMQCDLVGGIRIIACMGVGHAHRLKDVLLDETLPALPRNGFDQRAGDDIKDVVIGVGFTESRYRLQITQGMHQLRSAAVGVGEQHQIAFAQAQSAAMGEKIAHRHMGGDIGIVHLKARQPVLDQVGPFQFLAVHQDGERGRCEGFRFRSDRNGGMGVHFLGRIDLPQAIAFGQYGISILHDGEGQAGCPEGSHRLRHIRIGIRRGGRQGWRDARPEKTRNQR